MRYVGIGLYNQDDVFISDGPIPLEHPIRERYTIVAVSKELNLDAAIEKAKEIAKRQLGKEQELHG